MAGAPVWRVCVAVAALAASAGCDTTDVSATEPTGRLFTLWGQLDPTATRQAIRVDAITSTIDASREIDAELWSRALDTGVERLWRDSLVLFPGGTSGHVFVADFEPGYDSRYEIQVRQRGAVVAYARTTTPPRVEPLVRALDATPFLDLTVLGAPRLVVPAVEYTVYAPGHRDDVTVQRIEVLPSLIRSVDAGWAARLDLAGHAETLIKRLDERHPDEIVTTAFVCRSFVRAAVVDAGWAPPFPQAFSEPLLYRPGTVSNVRGGYGYLGAGYAIDRDVVFSPSQLRRARLQPGDCASSA